jgi:NodT family efflux transporter outer membrane factor (OMF) lipoprotein
MAALYASKKAILPSLSLSPQGQISSFDGGKAAKTYSVDLSSSWEIDAFGNLRNQKKQSAAYLKENEAYTQAIQTQLVATIAESYYTLLMLDRELEISEETVQTWKEYVKTLRALYEAGKTTSQAIAQNEATLLSTRNSMLTLKQRIHEQENALSTLIGMPAQSIKRSSLENTELSSSFLSGVSLELLGNRPDVRQAEYQLEEYFYGVNKARSAFYPKITLSGSAGWTNSNGGLIVNPGKILLNAIGSLTQPIFNRGQNTANLKISEAQYEEAKIAFTQKLLDAGKEVNNALNSWQTATEKQLLDKQQIEKEQEALRSTMLLMENGSTTNYIDVLTARQSLLQSRLSNVEDKYSELESIIKFYQSLGGGVK